MTIDDLKQKAQAVKDASAFTKSARADEFVESVMEYLGSLDARISSLEDFRMEMRHNG